MAYNLQSANCFDYAGNPTGNVAGNAGTGGGAPPDFCYDSTNKLLYACTTTGSTSTAVWTLVGATTPGGSTIYWATTGGSANALTATTGAALAAINAGTTVVLKTGASANSGATTLAVDSVAAKAVQKNGSACTGGELVGSTTYGFVYDGTQFQIFGSAGSGSGGGTTMTNSLIASSLLGGGY